VESCKTGPKRRVAPAVAEIEPFEREERAFACAPADTRIAPARDSSRKPSASASSTTKRDADCVFTK